MASSAAAFNRDANRVPITQNGLLVSKSITFAGNGAQVDPIFTITGSVLVKALYGVVTSTIGSNHTAASWRLNDQGAQIYLTAVGGTTVSSAGVGSTIDKVALVGVALDFDSNANAGVEEGASAGLPYYQEFRLWKKLGALTQIEYCYTTNNSSAGAMTFYCGFVPLSEDGDVSAA